jgi:hypothetical protein
LTAKQNLLEFETSLKQLHSKWEALITKELDNRVDAVITTAMSSIPLKIRVDLKKIIKEGLKPKGMTVKDEVLFYYRPDIAKT